MVATLSTAGRNAAADAIVTLIGTNAYLNFLASSGTTVAHLHFNATAAFGAASTGVCSLAEDPAVTNSTTTASETISTAGIYQSGGTAVFTAITCAATDSTTTQIVLSSLGITAGDTVTLDSLTLTMPATTTG